MQKHPANPAVVSMLNASENMEQTSHNNGRNIVRFTKSRGNLLQFNLDFLLTGDVVWDRIMHEGTLDQNYLVTENVATASDCQNLCIQVGVWTTCVRQRLSRWLKDLPHSICNMVYPMCNMWYIGHNDTIFVAVSHISTKRQTILLSNLNCEIELEFDFEVS